MPKLQKHAITPTITICISTYFKSTVSVLSLKSTSESFSKRLFTFPQMLPIRESSFQYRQKPDVSIYLISKIPMAVNNPVSIIPINCNTTGTNSAYGIPSICSAVCNSPVMVYTPKNAMPMYARQSTVPKNTHLISAFIFRM